MFFVNLVLSYLILTDKLNRCYIWTSYQTTRVTLTIKKTVILTILKLFKSSFLHKGLVIITTCMDWQVNDIINKVEIRYGRGT